MEQKKWPGLIKHNNKKSSAVADMPPEHMCTSYSKHCIPLVAIYRPDFSTRSHLPECNSWQHIFRHLPISLPSDTFNEGDSLELSGSYLVWEKQYSWATIWWKSHDDRLKSSVHNTWQTHRQPRRHSKCRPNALRLGSKNHGLVASYSIGSENGICSQLQKLALWKSY